MYSLWPKLMSVFVIYVRLNAERIQCCRKLLDPQYGKKKNPCPIHSCLKDHAEACTPHLPLGRAGNPAHATPWVCSCMHCLQMLQTTSCHLIPTPAMLHTQGCNKKFNHHLQVKFIFKMHFHSALCPPHRWLHIGGCRKLAPVFHGDLLPSVLCWLQRYKEMPRRLLVNHTFFVVWATLWGGSPTLTIPSVLCTPSMPELDTLQQKQCRFSSAGRAAL